MALNLDMDCLRTFITINNLGSFADAADHLHRTAPAISLQIKRLEDQLGTKIFQKSGRKMILSTAGENLLHKAQKILDINDEIVLRLSIKPLKGKIALGVIQDYADTFLPLILNKFKSTHPDVHITVIVDSTKNLTTQIKKGTLDLAIAIDDKSNLKKEKIKQEKMVWLSKPSLEINPKLPLPLVLLEAPCTFREKAIEALNNQERSWEIVFTSPSLSGLYAAIDAGLGITARTKLSCNEEIEQSIKALKLPKLPTVNFVIYEKKKQSESSVMFKKIIQSESIKMYRQSIDKC